MCSRGKATAICLKTKRERVGESVTGLDNSCEKTRHNPDNANEKKRHNPDNANEKKHNSL